MSRIWFGDSSSIICGVALLFSFSVFFVHNRCSEPSSPSVLEVGPDRPPVVAGLFSSPWTDWGRWRWDQTPCLVFPHHFATSIPMTCESFFLLSHRSRSAGSGFLVLLSASSVGVNIPLGALERALIISLFESSDIGSTYLDPRELVEFPGNSPGKSHVLGC